METPEEFLMKYGICSNTTIGIEGDKKLTELLEEYASQALRIHDVVGQSEQLCPHENIGAANAAKMYCKDCKKWVDNE